MRYEQGPREDSEKEKVPKLRPQLLKEQDVKLETVKANLAMQALAGSVTSLDIGAATVHTPQVPKEKAKARAKVMDYPYYAHSLQLKLPMYFQAVDKQMNIMMNHGKQKRVIWMNRVSGTTGKAQRKRNLLHSLHSLDVQ